MFFYHLQCNHIIFSGHLFWHIFCSCLLQNASDFWMKFFPTGCNFCSFFWVHQFCWINFRWRVVARDTFSLSILAYWMGYALYSILYLAMFRQQTIFFDIYIYIYIYIHTYIYTYIHIWLQFMKGKLLHMVSNIQRPAMNKLKTIFFLRENIW